MVEFDHLYVNRYNMIRYVLDAMKHKGDIVEIGLGSGDTTLKLLKVAAKYNRMVIGIDPFEDGEKDMPSSYRYPYAKFVDTIDGYTDRLDLVRFNSLSAEADDYFTRIALQTGELFQVRELAQDGKNIRFSPDNFFAIYDRALDEKQYSIIYDIKQEKEVSSI